VKLLCVRYPPAENPAGAADCGNTFYDSRGQKQQENQARNV
jgi:hypothetical protein